MKDIGNDFFLTTVEEDEEIFLGCYTLLTKHRAALNEIDRSVIQSILKRFGLGQNVTKKQFHNLNRMLREHDEATLDSCVVNDQGEMGWQEQHIIDRRTALHAEVRKHFGLLGSSPSMGSRPILNKVTKLPPKHSIAHVPLDRAEQQRRNEIDEHHRREWDKHSAVMEELMQEGTNVDPDATLNDLERAEQLAAYDAVQELIADYEALAKGHHELANRYKHTASTLTRF
jgi:chorismate mutase